MTRPTLRIAAATTAVLLPLGVLASCGQDDPKPNFDGPASAAPSESDSESPEEPVEPEPPTAMEKPNAAGAKAFVKYYFEVLSFATESGDVQLAKSLALDDCASCRGFVQAIEKTYGNGGSATGGAMTAERVRVESLDPLPQGLIPFGGKALLDVTRQVIEGSGDKELDGIAQAGRVPIQVQLIRSKSEWQMTEWSQTP